MVKICIGYNLTSKQRLWCERNLGLTTHDAFRYVEGPGWKFYLDDFLCKTYEDVKNAKWYAEFLDEETATLFLLST